MNPPALPLEGLIVLEFCQYLAGPWAGLRLSDLGARVIKVERPKTGEACRQLATKNIFVDGDSLVFHTVNRGKESFAADLKNPEDLAAVKNLIKRADVLTHNFRPGVMEKLGLDYDAACSINERLIYASVSGYGTQGPWRNKPGQDLLAQSLSGIQGLTGRDGDPPTPVGLAVADGICGVHLTQGILAALVRRGRTGRGGRVEVSLLASLMDLQFEALTTYLNDRERPPKRSAVSPGHPYQGAPYGVYETTDGHIAIAMCPLGQLADALNLEALRACDGNRDAFTKADEIRGLLADHLRGAATGHWLELLEPAGVWCAPVMSYEQLRAHAAYQALEMEQEVTRAGASCVKTLRCPVRLDGRRLFSPTPAPRVGEHNESLQHDLLRG